MPRVGFEPTIPVLERMKMVHALDRAATVIGPVLDTVLNLEIIAMPFYILFRHH
jgi:hypothetical protein